MGSIIIILNFFISQIQKCLLNCLLVCEFGVNKLFTLMNLHDFGTYKIRFSEPEVNSNQIFSQPHSESNGWII